ncbi:FixH family protein [Sanyastnella coralliicola]|uniref:FixH family protein n=1 Tax=Sanyastnella coralliicola TaxID=3069118 RepID=UPI0027B9CECF|nr:FixH family protein [Longitalea sp. SCSIO 12813]
MKFTWGHGITLFIIGFIIFMSYLTIQAFSVDFDLVAENYYEQELAYQEQLDRMQNLANAGIEPEVIIDHQQVAVVLNDDNTLTSGKIKLYSPASKLGDREAEWTNEVAGTFGLPTTGLNPGWYEVQVHWEMNGTNYYFEQEIELK